MRDYVDVEDRVRKDPIAGVAYMASRLGIDPKTLAAHMYNTYHGPQAPQAAQRASTEYTVGQIQSDIARFERDPSAPYFQQVRQTMAQLVQNGHANDLKSAYRMAVDLHPQLRVQQKMDRMDAKRTADMARARKIGLR